MPRAKLSVRIPSAAWIGDVSTAYPEVEFRVLAALPTQETGVGLVELTGPDLAHVVRAIEAREAILSLEILGRSPDRALIQFETSEPLLLFSVQESGVPLEPPIDIVDGCATVEVTASQDRLSTFGNQLEQFGMSFEVEFVRRTVDATEQLLTDRQRELILAAVTEGYYDTPRECSLTALADELDMAKSTVSETLHRAEETIIKEFVAELDEELITEQA
ncbi:helix-turn-helix domain-containing protein [Halorientalis brevis]|uniref:Helix-turn-helix domain-containing protein n=1 Tax=Halorientalis brevis TaxID=1126241 RepID=A0ABD6CGT3_9EURY|nr:helix-turn-helix domain-containing protein [Halorientalis brevis]